MNVSFGKTKEKAQQTAKSQTDPWDVVIPYVTDLLGKTKGPSAEVGPTTEQTAAYGQLKDNAAAGNPYAGSLDTLTKDLFASPGVNAGYADLERRLTPTAEGTNLDIGNDPYLQNLLKTVGDDAQWRINSMFAGAGRDLSGINQQAVGRGVTQAQAPILVDQLNREKARSDAAARDLFGAKTTAETTTADLRRAGVDVADAALTARDYGPNTIIDLEEQLKKMPYEELSWLAELLYPAAGLGEQTTGEGTSVKKGTSFGGKADLGSSLAALLQMV